MTVIDEIRDNIMTFGYINQFFRTLTMKNTPKLSQYLIRFIGGWVYNEYLHLVYDGTEH